MIKHLNHCTIINLSVGLNRVVVRKGVAVSKFVPEMTKYRFYEAKSTQYARVNSNKSEKLMTNTTTVSKYITKKVQNLQQLKSGEH